MRVFVAVAACALAGCATADRGDDAFDDSEEAPFVAAHNAVRAAASPAPDPPLPALVWDDALASVAQSWAERCVFEHSGNAYGENIAFFSGDASTPQDVVDGWASEAADYDYAANACAAGAQCGHYTQIVWRDTERVGCGAASCRMLNSEGLFWVCNYDPPGNFVGERPY